MCGIIGYVGSKDLVSVLLNGLKRLEYRGYDSAGMAIKTNLGITLLKSEGKITNLESIIKEQNLAGLDGNIGIAHTRWATHGKPTTINAHPHSAGSISLVHNGIIENYQELRIILEEEGFKFKSDTDSEVLAHLINKFYNGNLPQAVEKALNEVEGTYGAAVISKEDNMIVGAKKGSPLILGIGSGEHFLASSEIPIRDHTRRIISLKDGDIITITKDKYNIVSLGQRQEREIETIEWDTEALEKKGYKHFMLKEIHTQPETLTETLRGRIEPNKKNIHLGGFDNLPGEYFEQLNRIILLGCGTSWHACKVGKYLFEKTLRIPVAAEYASEFRYQNPVVNPGDMVMAVSQSGDTADTLAALQEGIRRGGVPFGMVNVVGSQIAREADKGIYLHAGPEIGVASTKAFTSQVLAFNLLNLYLGIIRNKISDEEAQDMIVAIESIPSKVREALLLENEIKAVAEEYCNHSNFLYLGRGLNFPVALEGALKLKEISYIHAEGYPAAEMKHGPIALIDNNMPSVFVATEMNSSCSKIISNMEQVRSRNGKIIAITTEDYSSQIGPLADHTIYVPNVQEYLSPIVNVIPLQLLAYHIADMKGLDVDKPRNLAKSVTVE
ncbi:glutamine--fructose-6-phosphate transaminase (isomerizing) [archaeon]|nr:glutamine--fructose-6-phosphate transaminase (isomerizing) [archaeon]MBL7057289.1 glutamine--fructose-6-phosphate transaminase (isomerizing) [Candidatus Woesearchaeota archaeon]